MLNVERLVIIILVLILVLVACAPATELENEDGFSYHKTQFEGMDCIVIDGYESLGITCNWEQYDG